MRKSHAFVAIFALTSVASLGCASTQAARQEDDEAAVQRAWNDPRTKIQAAAEPKEDVSPEMTVSGNEGTLNAVDVEGAIDRHRGELIECYGLDRRAKSGGRALLRFFVDGKGEVVDVAILESTIRHPRVERCLADIAVGVVLPPPSGRKPTTFDYPVEFRLASKRRP